MSLKITNATMARVEKSFRQLASAAEALNTASEDLSKVIRRLDASLKKLALGVSAWVPVSGTSDETQYWTVELGYAKVDSKWGLALREVTGYHLDADDESEEVWAYNEAPRTQRAEAVEKIPDLLEKLLRHTQETTREFTEKIEQANDFTTVVAELTPNIPPPVPQQFQRPEVNSAPNPPAPSRRWAEHEEQASHRPPQAIREPQPLPVERIPGERSAAANTAAQTIPRLREEESNGSSPAGAAIHPPATAL